MDFRSNLAAVMVVKKRGLSKCPLEKESRAQENGKKIKGERKEKKKECEVHMASMNLNCEAGLHVQEASIT